MKIRENFSRAAATYDRFADVQAEVAVRLATLLPDGEVKGPVMELGCGTGNFTALVRRRYPTAHIFAVDFAGHMLVKAAEKIKDERVRFVCQDIASFLAGTPGCPTDLIVSNATLQWLPDLGEIFSDIRKLLRPEGTFLFSIFGPQTLSELQGALDAVLPGKARLAAAGFMGREQIRRELELHFSIELEEEVMFEREYSSVLALLRQIGKTGTTGAHPFPLRLGHGHLRKMDRWFSDTYGVCRTGYQVIFYRCTV